MSSYSRHNILMLASREEVKEVRNYLGEKIDFNNTILKYSDYSVPVQDVKELESAFDENRISFSLNKMGSIEYVIEKLSNLFPKIIFHYKFSSENDYHATKYNVIFLDGQKLNEYVNKYTEDEIFCIPKEDIEAHNKLIQFGILKQSLYKSKRIIGDSYFKSDEERIAKINSLKEEIKSFPEKYISVEIILNNETVFKHVDNKLLERSNDELLKDDLPF